MNKRIPSNDDKGAVNDAAMELTDKALQGVTGGGKNGSGSDQPVPVPVLKFIFKTISVGPGS
jgi:hypothetical protein